MDTHSQSALLNSMLRDLAKFRAETVSFFDLLDKKTLSAQTASRKRAELAAQKTAPLEFLVDCLLGIGILVNVAAKGVNLTGKALKEANRLFMKKFAEQSAQKSVGMFSLVVGGAPVLEIAANATSPSFWAKKATLFVAKQVVGDPEAIYRKLIQNNKEAREQSLDLIDRDIKNLAVRIRLLHSGMDLSTLA